MSANLRHIVARRVHRERHQPQARAKLGILEKKADYRQRAKDYHKKQERLARLRRAAALRNPEEFVQRMVHTKVDKGGNVRKKEDVALSAEQRKLADTQDLHYVTQRRVVEMKQMEKLQSAAITAAPTGKRTVFVDSDGEEDKGPAPVLRQRQVITHGLDDMALLLNEGAPARPLTGRVNAELRRREGRMQKLQKVEEYLRQANDVRAEKRNKRKYVVETAEGGQKIYKWKQQRKK